MGNSSSGESPSDSSSSSNINSNNINSNIINSSSSSGSSGSSNTLGDTAHKSSSSSLPMLAMSPVGNVRKERSLSHSDTWQLGRDILTKMHKDKRYVILCADVFTSMAKHLCQVNSDRFKHYPIHFNKFPDQTDNIRIDGFSPRNEIAGEHVLFFASFHNNDVTLSQFSVLIVLLQSFIASLTIVLPFYPVGTNERVEEEGQVATANTYSNLLSNLPSCGSPTRLMIYDIHCLQNRFYFHNSTVPSLHSSIPLLLRRLQKTNITTIVFPDDGSSKRFRKLFAKQNFNFVICGKTREGQNRIIKFLEGDPYGKVCLIVDDLVQTGGTLYECGKALKAAGASSVHAFVAHAVFPNECYDQFLEGGNKSDIFETFFITNSIPTTTEKIAAVTNSNVFKIIDLESQILYDLDHY